MSNQHHDSPYDAAFYESQHKRSSGSAAVVLGHLFSRWVPESIIDFGCGVGTWLKTASNLGVERLVGLDGPWVPRRAFEGTNIKFFPTDLTAPISAGERFDLAISLEVAEHLPPERAADFVSDVCAAADVVLFGAAVPLQGGTHHVNEQFQSYWAALFRDRGYQVHDVVRPAVWNDPRVDYWYRQNTLLYVKKGALDRIPQGIPLAREEPAMVDIVHPELVRQVVRELENPSGSRALRLAGRAVLRKIGLTSRR